MTFSPEGRLETRTGGTGKDSFRKNEDLDDSLSLIMTLMMGEYFLPAKVQGLRVEVDRGTQLCNGSLSLLQLVK